jgi:translation initiation factor IF-2
VDVDENENKTET